MSWNCRCLAVTCAAWVAVTEIAWGTGFARCWFLLLQHRNWIYTDQEQAEFDDGCGFVESSYLPDGTAQGIEQPRGVYGGSTNGKYKVVVAELFQDVPRFSDWASIVQLAADIELVEEDRVELAVLRFEGEQEYFRVTAAKLVVSAEPVVSWEPALRAGEDLRLLGDDDYYGFGVDAGMGCFFDADAVGALVKIINDSSNEMLLEDVSGPTTAVVTEPESGATLVAYESGDGDGAYPTWIGRTASGEVGCFVSDMLILCHGAPAEEAVVSQG